VCAPTPLPCWTTNKPNGICGPLRVQRVSSRTPSRASSSRSCGSTKTAKPPASPGWAKRTSSGACYGSVGRFASCLMSQTEAKACLATRSDLVLSRASTGWVAMSPASAFSRWRSRRNASRCCANSSPRQKSSVFSPTRCLVFDGALNCSTSRPQNAFVEAHSPQVVQPTLPLW
jgi:hypothetical protein